MCRTPGEQLLSGFQHGQQRFEPMRGVDHFQLTAFEQNHEFLIRLAFVDIFERCCPVIIFPEFTAQFCFTVPFTHTNIPHTTTSLNVCDRVVLLIIPSFVPSWLHSFGDITL
eukprot:TRINITY_DN114954_c0_g1_i1.p2 TRINITY_DN114954_c0_g1~~TRINITY_DN114954_c0_g1_i1.p2  ORF type:complete len:112 (-),score=16.02 TRINITY_DN114954_c0_g1_i1:108-443(-)